METNQDVVKLTALYDLLKKEYEPMTPDDLYLNQPDEEDNELNICCDQKIIYCREGIFLISDLYDAHPTLQFATIEEVHSFFEGHTVGSVGANVETKAAPLTPIEIAYNVGRYVDAIGLMSITKEYFDKAQAKEWIKFGCGVDADAN